LVTVACLGFSPKGFGRAWPDLTPGLGSPTQASQSSDGWPPPLLCRPRVIGVNVPFGHCPLGSYCPGLTSRWVVPFKRELAGHQGVGESLPHAAVRRSKQSFSLAKQGYPRPIPSPVKVDGPYCGPTMRHAGLRSVRQLGSSHRSRPAAPQYKQFGNESYSSKVCPDKVRLSFGSMGSACNAVLACRGSRPWGGTCAVLKGDVEVTCHGVKVRRSRRRRLGWGRGRACHEGSWRGDVMRLAEGHVTGLAGCGSTLLQGSGEGNTKLSSDLSVRGAAYDELTR